MALEIILSAEEAAALDFDRGDRSTDVEDYLFELVVHSIINPALERHRAALAGARLEKFRKLEPADQAAVDAILAKSDVTAVDVRKDALK